VTWELLSWAAALMAAVTLLLNVAILAVVIGLGRKPKGRPERSGELGDAPRLNGTFEERARREYERRGLTWKG